jgi:hypothetical protein
LSGGLAVTYSPRRGSPSSVRLKTDDLLTPRFYKHSTFYDLCLAISGFLLTTVFSCGDLIRYDDDHDPDDESGAVDRVQETLFVEGDSCAQGYGTGYPRQSLRGEFLSH